jgi:hypothetical protein
MPLAPQYTIGLAVPSHPAIKIDTPSGPVINVRHTWHRLKAGLPVHPGAEHQNSMLGVRQQTPPTPGGEAFGLCLPFFLYKQRGANSNPRKAYAEPQGLYARM